MKYTSVAIAAVCTVISLTCAPRADAGHTLRADLPCPYGGAGPVNPTLWSPISASSSPYNPGAPTANFAALVAGSNITTDSGVGGGVAITGATQYDWYANQIPSVASCSDPNAPVPSDPIEQVINYKLAAGGTLGLAAGDTEVQFNYDPSLASTKGIASFTMGGVTFTSNGPLLPTGTDDDFLFSASGALLGALSLDSNGNTVLTTGVPTGWTASGGGSVSAPEIDSAQALSGLVLLLGGLTVLRGGWRSLPIRLS
jgi:hypothetical protein